MLLESDDTTNYYNTTLGSSGDHDHDHNHNGNCNKYCMAGPSTIVSTNEPINRQGNRY